jgi:hypothetical protein
MLRADARVRKRGRVKMRDFIVGGRRNNSLLEEVVILYIQELNE